MAQTTTSILLTILLTKSTALNILGIFPYQGKSHHIVYRPFLQELAKRGHNLTVVSHFPEEHALGNYRNIDLSGSCKPTEGKRSIKRSYVTVLLTATYLTNGGQENCEALVLNKQVQDLVKYKTKFDVVIAHNFNNDCALGIAYKLNAPVVGITTHIIMPWHYNRFGIIYNPSYVSFHFLEGGTKPTLYQRVERTFFHFYFNMMYYISQRNNQNTLALYYDNVPPLEELALQIKILLVYQNFVLNGPQQFPSNIIEVGGFHVRQAKPLTGELRKFVEDADHGVVYISFGTIIKSDSLSPEKTQAILDAMAQFPHRFMWKWDGKEFPVDKKKLYISDWLPQIDILGHSKTLVFLSHGGIGGTTEALTFGVPIIAVPVLGDQPANAAAIEESGLGVQISLNELTKENLIAAFETVLEPSFRANVKKIAEAWRNRPMPPMDTAIYWTEFVAKYPDIKYRSPAADVPLYQYLNLDVILVISATFVVLIFTVKIVLILCLDAKVKLIKNKKNV